MRESNGLCAQIFFGLSEFSYQTRVSIGHRIDMTLTHIITLNHVFFLIFIVIDVSLFVLYLTFMYAFVLHNIYHIKRVHEIHNILLPSLKVIYLEGTFRSMAPP
jgi:hypothetical protein